MKRKCLIVGFIFLSLSQMILAQSEKITLQASDGVTITADLYYNCGKDAPFIILCHRADWSRGEYIDIAPRLNKIGFNAIALDQRSGKVINGIINETAKSAIELKRTTTYTDAEIDIQTVITYIRDTYSPEKLILWGSSYSTGLCIDLANSNNVNGLLIFSTGEWYNWCGKSKTWVSDNLKEIKMPIFFASSKKENVETKQFYKKCASKNKVIYCPTNEGCHGSQILFSTSNACEEAWGKVEKFLQQFN